MVNRSSPVANEVVDVRQQILEAAASIFLHYGFKKTTMDDIARRVGISKGALYLHFDSKESIFLEISDQIRTDLLEMLTRIAADNLPPSEKLKRMHLESLLFVWDQHHQAPHAPEIWGETTTMFSQRNEEFFLSCQRIAARVIAEGQEQGVFRNDVDPERIAWVLAMACQGFAPPYLRVSERADLERGLVETLDLLLDGLSKDRQRTAS